MRKVIKTSVLWRCKKCGTNYKKKSDAKKCESMPIEEKKFKIGDRVTNSMELRICSNMGGEYRFKGSISKVLGPQRPDEEYWIKWLGGMPKAHVFWYEVAYLCPQCGQEKDAGYFAPELQLV